MPPVWIFMCSAWPILLTIMLMLFYRWHKRPKNFPPGPRGFPLIGVVPLLGRFPERTLKTWSKSYGPIMSVRFGSKDLVVINNYEYLQQVSRLL